MAAYRRLRLKLARGGRQREAEGARCAGQITATLLVLAGIALILALPELRSTATRYEPGDVLCWRESSARFGVVVDYDPAHRFRIGDPVPAYDVRRAGSNATLWISGHVVASAMKRAGSSPP